MHKRTIKKIRNWGIGIAGLALVAWLLSLAAQPVELSFEVESYPEQAARHVSSTHGFEYNSNPPTSGAHSGSPARAGFYDSQVPDANLIHSLEHGHVVVNYNCDFSDDCAGLQDQLRDLVASLGTWKIIANPRPENTELIAITAWRRVARFDTYDEEKIREFVAFFRDKGPEATAN